jgi:hypothetical protein
MLRICDNQTHLFCLKLSHCGGGIELSVILEYVSASLAEAFNSLLFAEVSATVVEAFSSLLFAEVSATVEEAFSSLFIFQKFQPLWRRHSALFLSFRSLSHCDGLVEISFMYRCFSHCGWGTLNSLFCAEIQQLWQSHLTLF